MEPRTLIIACVFAGYGLILGAVWTDWLWCRKLDKVVRDGRLKHQRQLWHVRKALNVIH